MLHGSFPRMKDTFMYEERGEWKLIVLNEIQISNMRAERVGINQIYSVFMPHLKRDAVNFMRYELHF